MNILMYSHDTYGLGHIMNYPENTIKEWREKKIYEVLGQFPMTAFTVINSRTLAFGETI
jgi:predicted glycosyltransferase